VSVIVCCAVWPHAHSEFTKVQRTFPMPDAPTRLCEDRAFLMAREVMQVSGLSLATWKPRSSPQAQPPDAYFHRRSETYGLFYFTNAPYPWRTRVISIRLEGTNATCMSRWAL